MNEEHRAKVTNEDTNFSQQVSAQAARKLKAQRGAKRGIWFGLGMSGLIGWSVTIPTLIGAALGIWVDKHYPSTFSWTLVLLLIGLILGCFNAWHWIDSEYKEMQEDPDE
jgi:ATP synthase protein I